MNEAPGARRHSRRWLPRLSIIAALAAGHASAHAFEAPGAETHPSAEQPASARPPAVRATTEHGRELPPNIRPPARSDRSGVRGRSTRGTKVSSALLDSSDAPRKSDAREEDVTDAFGLHVGQSVGSPRAGALMAATPIPEGSGYYIRHPRRAFGTQATIRHILAAIEHTRSKHPRVHRIAIGDMSERNGGFIRGHASHQSGRDVDIGFYFRRQPAAYPERFVSPQPQTLHLGAMWTLLASLCETATASDGVDWILLDYRIQRAIYEFAIEQSVPTKELERIFQYPRGPHAEVGIIRHRHGHDNHAHVRFKCSPQDVYCRDGVGPWRTTRPEQGRILPSSTDEAGASQGIRRRPSAERATRSVRSRAGATERSPSLEK